MARTLEDARRSLKKYIAEVLPEYEVRLAREEEAFERPIAVVTAVPAALFDGPAHTTDYHRPFVVYVYPEKADDAQQAQIEADRVAQRIVDGFRVGVGEGRPARVPLYDYDGVPIDGGSDRRDPRDYMRVEDGPSIATFPDPDDDRMYTITVDLRLGWRRAGRVPAGGLPVTDVVLEADVPPFSP